MQTAHEGISVMLVIHLHRAQSDTAAHCTGQILNYSGYRRQESHKTKTEPGHTRMA